MELFWNTIADYNASTWLYQLIIIVAGVFFSVMLIKHPRPWVKIAMKGYLIFLYTWIAVVYYLVYCSARNLNNILVVYWLIIAFVMVWDLVKGYTTFRRSHKHDILACALLSLPFLYPAFSLVRGLSFPMVTSPVMPCSVAVFSIGLFLLFSEKVNLVLVLFFCHWSIIAIAKTSFLNIPEDFILATASIPAFYFFFKDFFAKSFSEKTKPSVKHINILLILICVFFGALVAYSILTQLPR